MTWSRALDALNYRSSKMTGPAKAVLMVLAIRVHDNDQCAQTLEQLAADASLGIRTVRSALRVLATQGLVRAEGAGGRGRGNRYWLALPSSEDTNAAPPAVYRNGNAAPAAENSPINPAAPAANGMLNAAPPAAFTANAAGPAAYREANTAPPAAYRNGNAAGPAASPEYVKPEYPEPELPGPERAHAREAPTLQPAKRSSESTTRRSGDVVPLGPLFEAFATAQLERPRLVAGSGEGRAAQALLRLFSPAELAGCWAWYERNGSEIDQRNLSFGYLARNNRVGNWRRETARGGVGARAAPRRTEPPGLHDDEEMPDWRALLIARGSLIQCGAGAAAAGGDHAATN